MTAVKLAEDVDRKMPDEAARRSVIVADWTQEAIDAHLSRPCGAHPSAGGGSRGSGCFDISVRVDGDHGCRTSAAVTAMVAVTGVDASDSRRLTAAVPGNTPALTTP